MSGYHIMVLIDDHSVPTKTVFLVVPVNLTMVLSHGYDTGSVTRLSTRLLSYMAGRVILGTKTSIAESSIFTTALQIYVGRENFELLNRPPGKVRFD